MIERIAPVREFEPAFQDEFKVSADAFAEAFTPPSCAPPRTIHSNDWRGTMWQSVAAEALTAKASQTAQGGYVGDVVEIIGEVLWW